MKVVLIRHSKTAGNLMGRYIGTTDEPLCEEGIRLLENRSYPAAELVYVSPMKRCRETAALIYTAGTVADFPKSVMSSGRTLAVHMYNLASEGLYMDQAYATAVILLVLVVGINTLSSVVAKKLTKV